MLHGDVHEERNAILNHLDPQNSVHVIGAGSFSSGYTALPEATPRLYNLLEIDKQFTRIKVLTRAQRDPGGAFEPFAIYPTDDPDKKSGNYTIDLKQASAASQQS